MNERLINIQMSSPKESSDVVSHGGRKKGRGHTDGHAFLEIGYKLSYIGELSK